MSKFTITYGGFYGSLDTFVIKAETKEQAVEQFHFVKGNDRVIHRIDEKVYNHKQED